LTIPFVAIPIDDWQFIPKRKGELKVITKTKLKSGETMSAIELAKYLGVQPITIYRRHRAGKLPAPAMKIGRLKFWLSDLIAVGLVEKA
jgi:hypothetical protein